MTDLSKTEVLNALAAGEFSAAFALYLDVLVTLDFERMGVTSPDEALEELRRFLKAANSWLAERKLPVAWIACVERGRAGSLHAHIALHVPGIRRDSDTVHGVRYRTHFRRWAREAIARRVGEVVARSVNVRCSLMPSVISHWISVTYLLKGFDRSAVLVDARNSPDGQAIHLGDILPFDYRDPGDVGHGNRLLISGNLGQGRRKRGYPPSAQFMVPPSPDLHSLEVTRGTCQQHFLDRGERREARPFRSTVEDGVFDVRRIYGAEFAAFVTGIKSFQHMASPTVPADPPDLVTFLRNLEI